MGHLLRSLNTRKSNWEMLILRRVNKPLHTHAIIGRVHVFGVCRRPMPLYNLERHWFRPIHLSSHSHRGTVSRFNQVESKADQTAVVDLHGPLFLGDWWKHLMISYGLNLSDNQLHLGSPPWIAGASASEAKQEQNFFLGLSFWVLETIPFRLYRFDIFWL